MINSKRKQHYVGKHYLKAWTSNKGQLFCLRNRSDLFLTNPENVAQQRYFYRVENLTEQDLRNINLLIEKMDDRAKKIANNWINSLQALFTLKEFSKNLRVNSMEIENEINIQIDNAVEDYHARIEGLGADYLRKIIDIDLSFWNDRKACMDFCYYLAHQYFRTKAVKSSIVSSFNNFIEKAKKIIPHM